MELEELRDELKITSEREYALVEELLCREKKVCSGSFGR